MNFSVKKRKLLDLLNTSVRAISSNTPLPTLSGIKFDLLDDCLYLISSDSNISIKTCLKKDEKEFIKINEIGKIVIDAKYILEIVRKIDSDFINFELIDGTLIKIYGGNSEFKINGMNANEYPEINFEIKNNTFKLDSNIFFEIIDQTSFACSDSETRPILTGVNFKAKDGQLHLNATDSYRLASRTIDIDQNLDFNITVPSKYLLDIYHSISNEKEIEISIDNQKIIFIIGDSIIQTRLLDDGFPDVLKLIPQIFTQKITVSSKDFLSAIDRSSFIKSEGKNIVRLNINNEKIILTTSNQFGSSYETIALKSFEGEPFEISCSGKYLSDAIKAVDTDDVDISFSGDLKPFIVTNENKNGLIQLISPVRTYK